MDTLNDLTVEQRIELIKTKMPQTYRTIQAWAKEAGAASGTVFVRVRRGLAGKVNSFWAMEAGYVMGTPFYGHELMQDVARGVVMFGSTHACVLGEWTEKST